MTPPIGLSIVNNNINSNNGDGTSNKDKKETNVEHPRNPFNSSDLANCASRLKKTDHREILIRANTEDLRKLKETLKEGIEKARKEALYKPIVIDLTNLPDGIVYRDGKYFDEDWSDDAISELQVKERIYEEMEKNQSNYEFEKRLKEFVANNSHVQTTTNTTANSSNNTSNTFNDDSSVDDEPDDNDNIDEDNIKESIKSLYNLLKSEENNNNKIQVQVLRNGLTNSGLSETDIQTRLDAYKRELEEEKRAMNVQSDMNEQVSTKGVVRKIPKKSEIAQRLENLLAMHLGKLQPHQPVNPNSLKQDRINNLETILQLRKPEPEKNILQSENNDSSSENDSSGKNVLSEKKKSERKPEPDKNILQSENNDSSSENDSSGKNDPSNNDVLSEKKKSENNSAPVTLSLSNFGTANIENIKNKRLELGIGTKENKNNSTPSIVENSTPPHTAPNIVNQPPQQVSSSPKGGTPLELIETEIDDDDKDSEISTTIGGDTLNLTDYTAPIDTNSIQNNPTKPISLHHNQYSVSDPHPTNYVQNIAVPQEEPVTELSGALNILTNNMPLKEADIKGALKYLAENFYNGLIYQDILLNLNFHQDERVRSEAAKYFPSIYSIDPENVRDLCKLFYKQEPNKENLSGIVACALYQDKAFIDPANTNTKNHLEQTMTRSGLDRLRTTELNGSWVQVVDMDRRLTASELTGVPVGQGFEYCGVRPYGNNLSEVASLINKHNNDVESLGHKTTVVSFFDEVTQDYATLVLHNDSRHWITESSSSEFYHDQRPGLMEDLLRSTGCYTGSCRSSSVRPDSRDGGVTPLKFLSYLEKLDVEERKKLSASSIVENFIRQEDPVMSERFILKMRLRLLEHASQLPH